MVMVWLRKCGNLRSLILNTEKLYWIWSFYNHARKKNLFRSFLQFKVANKRLESSEAYLSCQRRLLNQEMSIKYKTIRALNNKITSLIIIPQTWVHNKDNFINNSDKKRMKYQTFRFGKNEQSNSC